MRRAPAPRARRARLGEQAWREAKLYYIGLLINHSQPELAETFFNSVSTRVLQRTYSANDLLFVRAAVSTEYIESDPPIYRSYYPNVDGERDCFAQVFADFGWSRPFRDLGRDLDHLLRGAGRAARRALDEPPAQLPDPGAGLALLSQQGRLRLRQARQWARPAPVRRARSARRGRPAGARHDPARAAPHQRAVLALARLLHGRHGGAVGLRPLPALDDAPPGTLRALHHARPRQAGQDGVLPRAPAAPAPLAGRVRRGARPARPGDARLHAPLVPLRLQGDPRRVRAGQGQRPGDRPLEVRDGQARRPRRAAGRHARVRRPDAAARALLLAAARPARTSSRRPCCATATHS